ncbi:MAG TPA: YIP1 family protein [Longimicrobiales bacterium]|nr:YIP1 family protein [Longimicrobiales bacterium]
MQTWGQRVIGAAKLDINTYEEVEADEGATLQAAAVVVLAALAQAVGAAGAGSAIGAAIGGLVGWAFWAGLTYLIGAYVFKGTATWGELLRTLGFAQSPRFLLVLGFIPLIGWVIGVVVFIWVLITGIVAIRQALDISTGKAIAVALIGWIIMAVISVFTGLLSVAA